MAKDINNNTTLKACPECINANGQHKFFFTNNLKKIDGQVVDGVSPQHWLRLTNRTGWPDGGDKGVDTAETPNIMENKTTKEDFDEYHVI